MQPEQFEDLGIDVVTGTEIMAVTGLTADELQDPVRFHRLKDVIDYVKNLPPEHRRGFLTRPLIGKNVDKLDHVWGYVELTKRRDAKLKELKELEEERSRYE